ncbi:hypothetical protein RYX36_021620 [Vicia faba]
MMRWLCFDICQSVIFVSWNTLIVGYSRVGEVEMAFWLLRCQEMKGVGIDDGTVAPLLTLLDGVEFCGLCYCLQDAERVFDGASVCRDIVTWNSMLAAYLLHKKEDLAFEVFIDMQSFGFEPDDYSYTGVISHCFVKKNKIYGESLHGLVIKRGLRVSVPVSNDLIAMYLGFDNRGTEDASKIFFSMDVKDYCTRNYVLARYVQVGWSEKALRCCSDLATLQLGQHVHVLSLKVGFDTNKYFGSSLIFMYSKCGVIEDATKSFETTFGDNEIVWNSIIFGYVQHRQVNIALELFNLIRERKMKPDHLTFVQFSLHVVIMGS